MPHVGRNPIELKQDLEVIIAEPHSLYYLQLSIESGRKIMPHGTTQWKLTTYPRQVTRKVPLTLSKAVNFLEFESRTVVTRSCGKRDLLS